MYTPIHQIFVSFETLLGLMAFIANICTENSNHSTPRTRAKNYHCVTDIFKLETFQSKATDPDRVKGQILRILAEGTSGFEQ